jgi:hypothetical protein
MLKRSLIGSGSKGVGEGSSRYLHQHDMSSLSFSRAHMLEATADDQGGTEQGWDSVVADGYEIGRNI